MLTAESGIDRSLECVGGRYSCRLTGNFTADAELLGCPPQHALPFVNPSTPRQLPACSTLQLLSTNYKGPHSPQYYKGPHSPQYNNMITL